MSFPLGKKPDTLYSVNKYNAPKINAGFGPGGFMQQDPLSFFGLNTQSTPSNQSTLVEPVKKPLLGKTGKTVLTAAAPIVGAGLNSVLSGGLSSGVGTGISSLGSAVGGAVSTVNPLLGAAISVGSGVLAGGYNALFGSSVDEGKKRANEEGTAYYNNQTFNAQGFDDVQNLTDMGNVQDAYKGGVFSKGSARSKNMAAREARDRAVDYAYRGRETNIYNIMNSQTDDKLAHYGAFGGPIETTGMGAIDYDFISRYLDAKDKQASIKDDAASNIVLPVNAGMYAEGGDIYIKPSHRGRLTELKERTGKTEKELYNDGNPAHKKMVVFARNARKWKHSDGGPLNILYNENAPLYAFGGDLEVQGTDYPTNLIHINAGGSHEENTNGGVQMGIDEQGIPNLVEEGEVIFNDYVFSNRINIDDTTKESFHVGKKKEMTYADLAKNLEKAISETPNDPISKAGFKAQMQDLMEQQERQKAEMAAEEAKKAFEALSPEEQQAVMQQVAQQDAMAQQAAMQQPSPEEIVMAQQQQAMTDGTEAMVGQEPQMNCFGGRINRFDNGGQAYTKMLNSLGFHTQKEFDDWAKENSIDFGDIWKDNHNTLSIDILGKLWSNEKFKEALKKKNPALAHAFETKGYDFGTYVPTSNSRATIQSISKGNWKATNGQGWFGSEDLAFKQATEGMSEDEIKALTTEQLAERMAKTDAYKNTSKWLENSDNALMYLNTLLNDPDTPDVAKKHALQYVKEGKWKDGYKYNYNDVFGKVRSTNPGTYWHTAMEANRGNDANNFVINEDGSIEPILGNVPTDWASAGNYSWADENSDYTYNYYKRPTVAAKPEAAKTPEEKEAEEEKSVAPKHRAEWLRYAGAVSPIVNLAMQAAGVGKPDTSGIDAAINLVRNRGTKKAGVQYIGDYLKYRPMDIWSTQNRAGANARATDRAILNSGFSPSAIAGLVGNSYASQVADSDLFRKALEYNDAQRQKVADFNRGTNMFNAEAYNKNSQFNAEQENRNAQYTAQLGLEGAIQKARAKAGWYNSLYGNVNNLFRTIGDIGRENAERNQVARLVASGWVPGFNVNSPMNAGYIKEGAYGGKINKKKKR